jgi:hypothetical protein
MRFFSWRRLNRVCLALSRFAKLCRSACGPPGSPSRTSSMRLGLSHRRCLRPMGRRKAGFAHSTGRRRSARSQIPCSACRWAASTGCPVRRNSTRDPRCWTGTGSRTRTAAGPRLCRAWWEVFHRCHPQCRSSSYKPRACRRQPGWWNSLLCGTRWHGPVSGCYCSRDRSIY